MGASIGGGSPQRRITEQQARELQIRLRDRGIEATTYVAMRYWHPFTESAITDMKADGITEVVALPLYPHFSISTSGSSFRELQRLSDKDPKFASIPTRCIRSYYNNSGYIAAMADFIIKEIQACPDPSNAHVFFSAHGVPKSYVEEAGDPYQKEIEGCVSLIMKKLEADLGSKNPFTLAYQSRVGPLEWLKPYTVESLRKLGQEGVKDLVVVPVSFVSEHIETLEEIDIEYREVAREAGITNFRRVPALGTSKLFIDSLANLVEKTLESPLADLQHADVLQKFPNYGGTSRPLKYLRTWLASPSPLKGTKLGKLAEEYAK